MTTAEIAAWLRSHVPALERIAARYASEFPLAASEHREEAARYRLAADELEMLATSRDSFRAAYEKQAAGDYAEIRLDDKHGLDEIVGTGRFHLERMDTNTWFLELAGVALFLDGKKVELRARDYSSWAEAQSSTRAGGTE